MLDLPPAPVRRRTSLTPMIDVVFLLLVFFMLAARFGMPVAQPLRLAAPASGAGWEGPPRLVIVQPDRLLLNGITVSDLAASLSQLMPAPTEPVVLAARDGATVQRLMDVMRGLSDAGMTNLVVVD